MDIVYSEPVPSFPQKTIAITPEDPTKMEDTTDKNQLFEVAGGASKQEPVSSLSSPMNATSQQGKVPKEQGRTEHKTSVPSNHKASRGGPHAASAHVAASLPPMYLQGAEPQKLPIRPGAEECLFYIHTGWCGYGAACRFNHPPEKMVQHRPKGFNSRGFPLRDNASDCSFFMRFGYCKFGGTCKFNHPQSVIDDAIRDSMNGEMASPPTSPHKSGPAPMTYANPTLPSSPQLHPASFMTHGSGGPGSPVSISVPTGAIPQAAMDAYSLPPQVFVYYVPQERCWSFFSTGTCQLGDSCPYSHH